MARVYADRVKQTSTSTGTGTFDLPSTVSGYRSFVSGIGGGNECYYCIVHQSLDEWEVGSGTVTSGSPATLSRTTVLASSNSGAAVNFSGGTKDVFQTAPADFFNRAAKAPKVTVLTSGSSTFNTTDNPRYLTVQCVGGGGGGAGSGNPGGIGGAGGTGGTTSFGTSLISCGGGAGNIGTGGVGGSASLGSGPVGVALAGAQGSPSGFINHSITGSYQSGSNGGASPFGGAGAGAYPGSSGYAAVPNTGSGGGGGATDATTPLSGSGGGAGGYVSAMITSPASSYAYAVGAGGAGGSAGTDGHAGGDGGSGIIIITEYY